MKKSIKFLPLLATGLLAVGCQDYDAGFTEADIKTKQYADKFVQEFGQVDPNQDWSMATLVEANVNLPELQGTAKMNIMTGDPRLSSTRLLAQIMLENGKGQIQFDAIKGQNNVFVTVEQDGQYKVFGQRHIENGMLNIGVIENPTGVTRAFSESCPVQKDGDEVTIGITYAELTDLPDDGQAAPDVLHLTYKDVEKTVDEWKAIVEADGSYGFNADDFTPFDKDKIIVWNDEVNHYAYLGWTFDWTDIENKLKAEGVTKTWKPASGSSSPDAPTHNIKLQYLSGVETGAAEPWYRADGYSLYGYDGFFEEQAHYFEAHTTILDHYADKLSLYGSSEEEQLAFMRKLEAGFEITSTGGVIELPFLYGATSIADQFGYVIYDDEEDPLSKTHYILMNDGRPAANVFQDSWKGDQIDYEANKFPGFEGTSIVNFILDKDNAQWATELSRPIKGTNGWCYCNEGTGIWSRTGEHLDECPAKDDETAECICEPWHGGGYFSEERKHADACIDPQISYKNMLNTAVYGTTYRLVYWDEELNGGEGGFTYTIPAGKKIVFFIMNQNPNTKPQANGETLATPNNYNYSLPELNQRIGHPYQNNNSPTYNEMKDKGIVKATGWNAGGKVYLGFEDGGGDEDLNDIVFMVEGAFTTQNLPTLYTVKWHMNLNGIHEDNDALKTENLKAGDTYTQPSDNPVNGTVKFLGWATTPKGSVVIPATTTDFSDVMPNKNVNYYAIWETTPVVPDPEYITWMFACEDLGSDFDYDFNDVVWEVRHEVGTSKLEARILAAGGTLPFALQYKGESVKTKEQAFGTGCNGTVMIKPTPTEWFTVSESVADDWSVTTNASEFSVLVSQEDGSVVSEIKYAYSKDDEDATKNNKTPQVIIVPYDWRWPLETHKISLAYPGFTTWAADATWAQWSANIDEEHVVTR